MKRFTVVIRQDKHSTHARLQDAIDQADLIHGSVDFADVKIVAGDRDTGYIDSIDGTTAMVRWDSGVVTPCNTYDIEVAVD